jgi:hypothetical protein
VPCNEEHTASANNGAAKNFFVQLGLDSMPKVQRKTCHHGKWTVFDDEICSVAEWQQGNDKPCTPEGEGYVSYKKIGSC